MVGKVMQITKAAAGNSGKTAYVATIICMEVKGGNVVNLQGQQAQPLVAKSEFNLQSFDPFEFDLYDEVEVTFSKKKAVDLT